MVGRYRLHSFIRFFFQVLRPVYDTICLCIYVYVFVYTKCFEYIGKNDYKVYIAILILNTRFLLVVKYFPEI